MKSYSLLFYLFITGCSSNQTNKNIVVQQTQKQTPKDSVLILAESSTENLEAIDTTYVDEFDFSTSQLCLEAPSDAAIHSKTYNTLIGQVKDKRIEFKSQLTEDSLHNDSIIQLAQSYIFNTLTNDVLPFWYGTPWDFNGISNKPKEGEIACGYFVSTPLKHIGFNLNRYRVAQKGATEIIHTLAGKDGSKTYTKPQKLVDDVLKRPDGIYIIGLSSHVGFVEKRGKKVYFTHSNYLSPCEVIREDFISSPAILSSSIYVLGDLSLSKKVILTWLNETEIKV